MNAKDIMATTVVAVRPDTSVNDVASLLAKRRISAVPVIDNESGLVGIVSEDDLIHRDEFGNARHPAWWLRLLDADQEKAIAYVKSHGRIASDVMTRNVVTVEPETSLKDVAKILETRRIKRVPVVQNGKVIGIVSRANLLQALAMDKVNHTIAVDDEIIRRLILNVLRTKTGLGGHNINVIVSEGVVHLWGAVHSEDERRAVVIAAESARGAKQIEDNLKIVDPVAEIPWDP